MISLNELENILPDYSSEDSNKHKRKKTKRMKKDKNKKKKKGQHWLTDETDCFEPNTFTQMPKSKKGKKKKKSALGQDDEFPLLLTQPKKLKLSKQRKQEKVNHHASDTQKFKSVIKLFPHEHELIPAQHQKSLAVKDKPCHKKKVNFKLSPEEILPKTPPNLYAVRNNFQIQRCSSNKAPFPTALLSENGGQNKPSVEENGLESQSTAEDINSQDLFITQKCFSVPCTELTSSASTDDAAVALPPHQQTKTHGLLEQKPPCNPTVEATTQTENFFTSPWFATSLAFHHQIAESLCTEEPMDLSVSNRSRKNLHLHQQNNKPVEDQSRPDQKIKITDVTSSDDSDTLSKSKADLSQLKMVQTRLNESFFFKLKGDGESPKPRSPLMKLRENVEKKSKK